MTFCLLFLFGVLCLIIGGWLLAESAPPTIENSPFEADEWDPEKRYEYGPDHDFASPPRVTVTRRVPGDVTQDTPELKP